MLREIGGCTKECSRECSMWGFNRKSTLGSTPWCTPNLPQHSREHPPEHPDFREHPREHFPEHFQGSPTLAPLCLADGIATLKLFLTMNRPAIIRPNSEPFAIGPVQLSRPRGVAENWFTRFWEHFVSLSLEKQQNTEFSKLSSVPDPGNLLNLIFWDWPRSGGFRQVPMISLKHVLGV